MMTGAHAAEPVSYQVRAGDTLIALSTNYLKQRDDYKTVQQLNEVRDPYRLVIGSTLVIPRELLRTEPLFAEISSFRGAVTVDGQPATLGMKIGQGMRIETGANAFVTVKLPDNSTISLPSQSRVSVAKLRSILLTGGMERAFRLEEGRSRSVVTPIRTPGSNFEVSTPLSVSAVRGTDFRVAVDSAGGRALTEVVGGTVGVAPDSDKPAISVPKAFGVVATPAGVEEPVALLAPPQLGTIGRTANGILIAIKPVEGAAKYRTQLATDAAFQDVFDEVVSDTPSAGFTLSPNTGFFIRLTAIAASGMEGLPATYALGQRIGAVDAPKSIELSMTGDGRTNAASIGPHTPLR